MVVYRICNELEKNTLLNERSFNNIGHFCYENKKTNTHFYKDGKKYIHFFKDFDSIFYLKTTKNHYICTYDIPDSILISYKSLGFYLDRMFFRKIDSVVEYTIENELLDFNYLISIDEIINDIDFDDCIDESFYDKLNNIYKKEREISKKIILE